MDFISLNDVVYILNVQILEMFVNIVRFPVDPIERLHSRHNCSTIDST